MGKQGHGRREMAICGRWPSHLGHDVRAIEELEAVDALLLERRLERGGGLDAAGAVGGAAAEERGEQRGGAATARVLLAVGQIVLDDAVGVVHLWANGVEKKGGSSALRKGGWTSCCGQEAGCGKRVGRPPTLSFFHSLS